MHRSLILATIVVSGAVAYAQGFSSLSDFWGAAPAEVDRRLHAQALDLNNALDRMVRETLDELDRLSETTTNVYWADGYGSHAHPTRGIGLDRQQLRRLVSTQSDADLRDAVRFILAHEQAHMAQFKRYTSGLDDPARRRPIEAQADILGGFTFVGTLFRQRRPPSSFDFNATSKRLLMLADKIGSPGWDDQTQHPRPEQRERAISLGILSQIQAVDWQLYEKSKDPDILARIRSAESKFLDIYKPGETFMDWSNAMAKRIVRYQQ